MVSQSAAFALKPEFLPKDVEMHRIVGGEEGRRPSRESRKVSQCHRPVEPSTALPIPFPPSHIPRTKSELQLIQDMHAAEWRDLCMFQRLVTGMRERRAALESQNVKPKTLAVSPYQSCLTSSPAQGPLVPLRKPNVQQAPANGRQHLQNVLHVASGLADEGIQSMTTNNKAVNWYLDSYAEALPQQVQGSPTAVASAATQHQSYFIMGPPAKLVEDNPEDEHEEDDEIFCLDI